MMYSREGVVAAKGEPPEGGVAALPTTFSGVACCGSCPRSLRDLRAWVSEVKALRGSHAQKHQSNMNNTSLVLSVIGELLRGTGDTKTKMVTLRRTNVLRARASSIRDS